MKLTRSTDLISFGVTVIDPLTADPDNLVEVSDESGASIGKVYYRLEATPPK